MASLDGSVSDTFKAARHLVKRAPCLRRSSQRISLQYLRSPHDEAEANILAQIVRWQLQCGRCLTLHRPNTGPM